MPKVTLVKCNGRPGDSDLAQTPRTAAQAAWAELGALGLLVRLDWWRLRILVALNRPKEPYVWPLQL